MKIELDDPRVTAFALGELEEGEREELERALAEQPELREAVEEIRAMADQLRQDLAEEPREHLSPEQRKDLDQRIEAAPAVPIDVARKRKRRIAVIASTSLAATVLLAFGGTLFLTKGSLRSTASEEGWHRFAGEKQAVGWLSSGQQGSEGKMGSRKSKSKRGLYGLKGPAGADPNPTGTLVLSADKNLEFGPLSTGELPADEATRRARRAALQSARLAGIRSLVEDGKRGGDGEAYARIAENAFVRVAQQPLSTFSIDVDTAAYANVRRFLTQETLPPPDAVRIEEMVNYFPYSYPQPTGSDPFSVSLEVARAPWSHRHRLVRIGLKGRELSARQRKPSNLVFLIDVSGSMDQPSKLPLLRSAMSMLVQQLGENDRVAIAVYAGSSGMVLGSTACTDENKPRVLSAIERLQAGGSTNGGEGIQLAYSLAAGHFIQGGVNRVLLATDGDFNVGVSDKGELIRLIQQKAKTGVFLSVLGFGSGNLKDENLEQLADKGNGHYSYIDNLTEARKVLVEQMSGTLVAIAKDVKIQVEFNPAKVSSYRLIGYENRMLATRDFNDDKKDAGEIGAGHTVTALYEVVAAGESAETDDAPALRYQPAGAPAATGQHGDELLLVKLRYKQADGDVSRLLQVPLRDSLGTGAGSTDFRFAAAVAWFGMALRGSPHAGKSPYGAILDLAQSGRGADPQGYRAEMIRLVEAARRLSSR